MSEQKDELTKAVKQKEKKTEEKKTIKETKKVTKGETKKSKSSKVSVLYKIQENKIVRLRPTCERCGAGFFMADHNSRYTCGHCGFTKYKEKSDT